MDGEEWEWQAKPWWGFIFAELSFALLDEKISAMIKVGVGDYSL